MRLQAGREANKRDCDATTALRGSGSDALYARICLYAVATKQGTCFEVADAAALQQGVETNVCSVFRQRADSILKCANAAHDALPVVACDGVRLALPATRDSKAVCGPVRTLVPAGPLRFLQSFPVAGLLLLPSDIPKRQLRVAAPHSALGAATGQQVEAGRRLFSSAGSRQRSSSVGRRRRPPASSWTPFQIVEQGRWVAKCTQRNEREEGSTAVSRLRVASGPYRALGRALHSS